MLPFEYVLIKDLRDQGIDATAVSDELATELIQLSSDRINKHTGQWFVPVLATMDLDGRDSSVIFLPNYIPIIEVTKVVIDADKSVSRERHGCFQMFRDRRFFGTLSGADVIPSENGRFAEFVAASAAVQDVFGRIIDNEGFVFARGRRNVNLSGTFGNIFSRGVKLTATTSGAVLEGAVEVVVDDVTGWRKNDVAVFLLAAGAEVQIVVDIDKGANKLLFPAPDTLKFDVPDATKVENYGRVPLQIRRCAIRLVNLNQDLIGSIAASQAQTAQFIIAEKTDNYEYKLDPDAVAGLEQGSTGDSECDRILDLFSPPPYVGFV